MKKILSMALVCVLLVCSVFALASCAKTISGTYEAELNLAVAKTKVSYEFKGNNVTVTTTASALGVSMDPKTAEGTYEITEAEDGSMSITFTWGKDAPEGADKGGVALDFEEGEDYIKIGLVKYTKATK